MIGKVWCAIVGLEICECREMIPTKGKQLYEVSQCCWKGKSFHVYCTHCLKILMQNNKCSHCWRNVSNNVMTFILLWLRLGNVKHCPPFKNGKSTSQIYTLIFYISKNDIAASIATWSKFKELSFASCTRLHGSHCKFWYLDNALNFLWLDSTFSLSMSSCDIMDNIWLMYAQQARANLAALHVSAGISNCAKLPINWCFCACGTAALMTDYSGITKRHVPVIHLLVFHHNSCLHAWGQDYRRRSSIYLKGFVSSRACRDLSTSSAFVSPLDAFCSCSSRRWLRL